MRSDPPALTPVPDPAPPSAPSHLSAGSKRLWKSIADEYELDDATADLLRVALEARDRANTASRRIRDEGVLVEDRFGQLRAHPAIDVERHAADRYARLAKELGLLGFEEEAESRQPRNLRGRYDARPAP